MQYRLEALAENVETLRDRGEYLLTWAKEGSSLDAGAGKFPEMLAMKPLLDHELQAAQEKDRLENEFRSAASELEGLGPSEAAERILTLLEDRVAFLREAYERLEDVTDWIESFRKTGAGGEAFGEYLRRSIGALDVLNDLTRSAADAAANALTEIQKLLRLETTQEQAQAEAEAHRAEEEAARARAQAARERADQCRTPNELSRILGGTWRVEVFDPVGNLRDVQRARLERAHFGSQQYQAISTTGSWRADGSWLALDGVRVQVTGLQSGFLPGYPVMGLSETLTFSVADRDHLDCSTSQHLRMVWSRS
jgi:hypothetical protein